MTIYPARIEDLPAIMAIERETPEAPHWSVEAYRTALQIKEDGLRRCIFAARVADEIAGFAVGSLLESRAELESVAVRTSARRRGVGKALCRTVLGWAWDRGAASVELEVRAGGAEAQNLYVGLGFAECGRRPGYYRGPVEDAVLMRLERAAAERQGL